MTDDKPIFDKSTNSDSTEPKEPIDFSGLMKPATETEDDGIIELTEEVQMSSGSENEATQIRDKEETAAEDEGDAIEFPDDFTMKAEDEQEGIQMPKEISLDPAQEDEKEDETFFSLTDETAIDSEERGDIADAQEAISFEEDKILQSNPFFANEIVRCVQEAIQTFQDGLDVIISSAPYDDSVNNTMLHAKRLGLNEVEVREKIEEALSLVTNKILKETEITDLILIGGATTFKIFKKRGINEAEIRVEVLPGIPMLVIKEGIRVVTKAGGFGSEDALIHVVKHLRRTCKK